MDEVRAEMKYSSTTASVLLLLSVPLTALSQDRSLQLTTEIISQRYCAAGPDVNTMQLRLRLRYTNTGDQKLIIYKGDKLYYRTVISRHQAEAPIKKYDVDLIHARYSDGQTEHIEGPSPTKAFIILRPGSIHQIEQTVSVPVMRTTNRRIDGALEAGEHTVRVTVSTWYESKQLAEALRERWQRNGFLWTNTVASIPVRFIVNRQNQVSPCQ